MSHVTLKWVMSHWNKFFTHEDMSQTWHFTYLIFLRNITDEWGMSHMRYFSEIHHYFPQKYISLFLKQIPRNITNSQKYHYFSETLLFLALGHPATLCDTLQHSATHWNTLHYTATHCNTLQHTATHCNTLQHTATHCSTLQHTVAHCNTLQHTATHCDTL